MREQKGLKQADLAAAAHVSVAFISMLETARTTLSAKVVEGLERAYGVNRVWLRTGVGEMFSPS